MIPFRGNVPNREINRDRRQISGCLELGSGGRLQEGQRAKACRVSFGGDKMA